MSIITSVNITKSLLLCRLLKSTHYNSAYQEGHPATQKSVYGVLLTTIQQN